VTIFQIHLDIFQVYFLVIFKYIQLLVIDGLWINFKTENKMHPFTTFYKLYNQIKKNVQDVMSFLIIPSAKKLVSFK